MGTKCPPGRKGPRGPTGATGSTGTTGTCPSGAFDSPLTFNWSFNSNDGVLIDNEWSGSTSMQLNNETYHIFTASITGPVTVDAVFNVQDSASDAVVNIDEITPTNYNGGDLFLSSVKITFTS